MAAKKYVPVHDVPRKIIRFLAKDQIPFIVVGGMAIVLHGFPRSTLDIDIYVPSDINTVSGLFSAAEKAGLHSQSKDLLKIADRPELLIGQWIAFEDADKRELFDVFFEDPKVFNGMLKKSIKRKMKDFYFHIASLSNLEAMKRASGRPLDLADIALIKERRRRKNK